MAGVLDAGGGPPPAPRPDQMPSAPSNGVLSAPAIPAPPAAPQQRAAPVPAPTHAQTVAVLRHMDAIQRELQAILKDDDVGKSDVKSKIIDGMTRLVSERIITPGAAVAQLANVPESPFQQKKWLQQHLVQAIIAKVTVMQHHANAWGGTPEHMIDKTSSPDDHLSHMAAVSGHYGVGRA